MSQANVEVVQAFFDAYNAGDTDAFIALADPHVIWVRFEGWPEPETLIGREACMRQWERLREAFEVNAVEPITDFISAGDRVVVRISWRGIGRGPEMNIEMTCVYTVRKGKIFILEYFWDHAEALKTIGIEA